MQVVLPEIRMQRVSAAGLTELWQEMSPWIATVGVSVIRGVEILAEKSGNFRFRIGIQVATFDIDAPELRSLYRRDSKQSDPGSAISGLAGKCAIGA
jgi:hypothetical protein